MARQFSGRERNFPGEHFWARGYAVSTIGFELEQVRIYKPRQHIRYTSAELTRPCIRTGVTIAED